MNWKHCWRKERRARARESGTLSIVTHSALRATSCSAAPAVWVAEPWRDFVGTALRPWPLPTTIRRDGAKAPRQPAHVRISRVKRSLDSVLTGNTALMPPESRPSKVWAWGAMLGLSTGMLHDRAQAPYHVSSSRPTIHEVTAYRGYRAPAGTHQSGQRLLGEVVDVLVHHVQAGGTDDRSC
jgi:hypothetical protein